MMHQDLLPYSRRELRFLRQALAGFAAQHRTVADRLGITGNGYRDPHVERLLQAFAWLTARIHTRLDDAFPEIIESFFQILSPHYLSPFPSLSIAQVALNTRQGKPTHGYSLAPGTMLTAKHDVRGVTCRFRTCYPLMLWPLHIAAVRLETPELHGPAAPAQRVQAVLSVTLRCTEGLTIADLALQHLRFHLHGNFPLTTALYMLLFRDTLQVQLRSPREADCLQPIRLSPACLRPVGFARDEGLLPSTPYAFLEYRLIQEYFAFPQKFLFFDLYELDRAVQAGFGEELELRFLLRHKPQLDDPLEADTFRLGCTPIVNLFAQRAEPIRLDHRQSDYQVIPDVGHPDGTEVYAIDDVTSATSYRHAPVRFVPFYDFKHASARGRQPTFWYASRRPSLKPADPGTEVYLTLVDLDLHPSVPEVETLIVKTTCTNRDRARELRIDSKGGDFDLEEMSDVAAVYALEPLTAPLRVPLRQSLLWRLIAHLSLNYVSIPDGDLEALREILTLHDVAAAHQRHIDGITALTSRRVIRRPASLGRLGFCQGTEVTLRFNDEHYEDGELFLFASVLERFFGLCASLNTFSQLVATTDHRVAQTKEPFHVWLPRAGEQVLR